MKFDDLLLALIFRKPSSGYELKRWLATEGQFLRANADQAQIYRTLHRLRKRGFIEFTVEQRGGGPDARVYSGTRAGADHLIALTNSPYQPRARWQEPDFMARYACLCILNPPSVLSLIETELEFRRARIAEHRHRDRTLHVEPGLIPIDYDIAQEMLDDLHFFSSAAVDAWIVWLESQHAKWSERLGVRGDGAGMKAASPR